MENMLLRHLVMYVFLTIVSAFSAALGNESCHAFYRGELRPLPIAFSGGSLQEWAAQYSTKYKASHHYDYVGNTPKPDFSFTPYIGTGKYAAYRVANKIPITGPDEYSIPFILKNLGLSDSIPTMSRDLKIISVGEGLSELAPTLAKEGFNIQGVDIWYEAKNLPKTFKEARNETLDGEEVYNYVTKNKAILTAADATRLPYQTESIDLVLSHQLINNLSNEMAFLAVQEMIRVIKKGGQARIAFHDVGFFDSYIELINTIPWLKVHKIHVGSSETRYGELNESLLLIEKTNAAP